MIDVVAPCASLRTAQLVALGLSTSGLQQWLLNNAVTVLVVILGLAALMYALKAEASKVLSVVTLSLAGLAMVAIGTIPGAPAAVGKFVAGLFGAGGGG